MKLLIYDWNSWFRDDLLIVLKRMKIDYDLFTWDFFEDGIKRDTDDKFEKWFIENCNSSRYDAVFSINIWEPISKACELKGIKYISWSYDSPINVVEPEKCFQNELSTFFLYDRYEANKYRQMGFSNVYHMPLGVNTERFLRFDVSNKECDKYRTDISFVGGLYNNVFGDVLGCLEQKTQDVLQKIVDMQLSMGGNQYVIDTLLTDGLVLLVSQQLTSAIEGFEPVTKRQLEFTLCQEVTRRERIMLLNLLGSRYKTDLYSNQTFEVLKGINQKSTVDYFKEMPVVFAASRINLNPALFAIRSGVSLRAFDITACGGFLLSNYKEEYSDLFEVDKEMVIYTSFQDAVEKADFYLRNEKLRENVAKAGRARTVKDHKMEYRIADMIRISGL